MVVAGRGLLGAGRWLAAFSFTMFGAAGKKTDEFGRETPFCRDFRPNMDGRPLFVTVLGPKKVKKGLVLP